MASYAIVNYEVTDREAFKEYLEKMPKLLERYGARYIVGGRKGEKIEGSWDPKRITIIEYPSAAAQLEATSSDEYKALKRIRDRSTRCDIIHVDGG